jgi:hypothetical protein
VDATHKKQNLHDHSPKWNNNAGLDAKWASKLYLSVQSQHGVFFFCCCRSFVTQNTIFCLRTKKTDALPLFFFLSQNMVMVHCQTGPVFLGLPLYFVHRSSGSYFSSFTVRFEPNDDHLVRPPHDLLCTALCTQCIA